MKFLLLLVMLTACAAAPQDLSGKMFTFPQQTNSAHVRLETSREEFSAVTVCLRSFTDLSRNHVWFSLATPSAANDFLIFKKTAADVIELIARNSNVEVVGQEYKLNTWHSVCATWSSQSGLGQLWLDGKPSAKKFISSGSNIKGKPIIILGQEQDSYGGRFDKQQCFTGMISDVHMWDYALSPCEIQRYVDDLNFTPGNVLNWRALQFQITGRVLLENKPVNECH
ncbi:C-reactive protein-like [Centroberyx affinis]|uniref:C-reactive protein-like n=1 Tax=Centroberyx affinis TaxID=166261 RepID=UPI003A5C04FC